MFDGTRYEVRQRISIGNKYAIYEGDGDEPILQSAQKKLRLKEEFRFTDPATGDERFRVKANSVLDVATAYDVVDVTTDERIGSVRRRATSFLRHEYDLISAEGEVVAVVKEDSPVGAFVRRYVTTLVPFSYTIESPSGESLGSVRGAFSVRDRYVVDLTGDIDPRLAVIATVVVDAIEEN